MAALHVGHDPALGADQRPQRGVRALDPGVAVGGGPVGERGVHGRERAHDGQAAPGLDRPDHRHHVCRGVKQPSTERQANTFQSFVPYSTSV
jgi:hypothetical protein